MPVDYRIENQIVEFLMTDGYTFEEFKRVCFEVLADADFKPSMKSLVNLWQARPNPPTQEMRDGAAFLASLKERFAPTWAILAPPNSLTYGLARMFSVFAENKGIELEVFIDRTQALAYLRQSNLPKQTG